MDYKRGDLENVILNAIWHMEENGKDIVSVGDVQQRINDLEIKKWAYTTVKTVMDRLVQKALVSRLKQGKKYFYKSSFSRAELGRLNIQKVIKQYYNGNIQEFLEATQHISQDVFASVE